MTGFDRKSVHPYWLIESDSRVTVRVQARGLPSLVFCGLVIFSRAGNEKEKKPERNVCTQRSARDDASYPRISWQVCRRA